MVFAKQTYYIPAVRNKQAWRLCSVSGVKHCSDWPSLLLATSELDAAPFLLLYEAKPWAHPEVVMSAEFRCTLAQLDQARALHQKYWSNSNLKNLLVSRAEQGKEMPKLRKEPPQPPQPISEPLQPVQPLERPKLPLEVLPREDVLKREELPRKELPKEELPIQEVQQSVSNLQVAETPPPHPLFQVPSHLKPKNPFQLGAAEASNPFQSGVATQGLTPPINPPLNTSAQPLPAATPNPPPLPQAAQMPSSSQSPFIASQPPVNIPNLAEWPLPPAVPPTNPTPPQAANLLPSRQPEDPAADEWNCLECTYLNKATASEC